MDSRLVNFILLISNIEVKHPPDISKIESLKSCSKQILDVNSQPSPLFLTLAWWRTWSLTGSGCPRTREAIWERLYSSLNSDSTDKKQQIYTLFFDFFCPFSKSSFSYIYFLQSSFSYINFFPSISSFTSLFHQVPFKITAVIIILSTFCISITYFIS